jgi:hypothetical protein
MYYGRRILIVTGCVFCGKQFTPCLQIFFETYKSRRFRLARLILIGLPLFCVFLPVGKLQKGI